MSSKRWCIGFLVVFVLMLSAASLPTLIIDPYFHYHKPNQNYQYPIYNERYQNDGIVKNFEYNALITGTSMTENFKTTDLDKIFGVNAIKVPFSGGRYKEIDQNIRRAIKANPSLKFVLRGLDYNMIVYDKDDMRYDVEYPTYLYDYNILNDTKYLFNKSVFYDATLKVVEYTKWGSATTSFDDYASWNDRYTFGKEVLDGLYNRVSKVEETIALTEQEKEIIKQNIEQNVIETAEENPDIDFYLFWTPYSIYYWDDLNQRGILEKQLEAEKYASSLMLSCDNIYLFSFFDEYDMICNLDNYKDTLHYGEWINTDIIEWMKSGQHLLTEENYNIYWDAIHEFYTTYDYDAMFVSESEAE